MEDSILLAANIIMRLREINNFELTRTKVVKLQFLDENYQGIEIGISGDGGGFNLELWNEFYPFFEQALAEYGKALESELHNLTGKMSDAEVSA